MRQRIKNSSRSFLCSEKHREHLECSLKRAVKRKDGEMRGCVEVRSMQLSTLVRECKNTIARVAKGTYIHHNGDATRARDIYIQGLYWTSTHLCIMHAALQHIAVTIRLNPSKVCKISSWPCRDFSFLEGTILQSTSAMTMSWNRLHYHRSAPQRSATLILSLFLAHLDAATSSISTRL